MRNNHIHLTNMINSSYENDELILVVIHGKQGFGKSTYAGMVMSQVLGSWRNVKDYFVFKPRDFLTLSRKQSVKSPVCCVDDAGLWLNNMDFHHPLVKATGKFLEVARTKWAAILFTCSDLQQIFSKLRNMPHVYTVRITKHGGKEHVKDRRIATIFEGWKSEDQKKSGRKTKAVDVFYAHMPGHYNPLKPELVQWNKPNNFDDLENIDMPTYGFYGWYKPERDKLADQGLDELELELNKLNV